MLNFETYLQIFAKKQQRTAENYRHMECDAQLFFFYLKNEFLNLHFLISGSDRNSRSDNNNSQNPYTSGHRGFDRESAPSESSLRTTRAGHRFLVDAREVHITSVTGGVT